MTDSTLLPRTMFIEEFLPLKGARFVADCEPKPAELELLEIVPGRHHRGLERPSFTLIFHSQPEVLLVEGLYSLRSGAFGPAAIYIQGVTPPLGPDVPAGHFYQAVFS